MIILGWVLLTVLVLNVLIAPSTYQGYIDGKKPKEKGEATVLVTVSTLLNIIFAYYVYWTIYMGR